MSSILNCLSTWQQHVNPEKQVTLCLICGFSYTQVCDSDTMLDPASSVEMVKVLEEDPMVGGVGGDVQVG